MCGIPDCDTPPTLRTVKVGDSFLMVKDCPSCDRRRCESCHEPVQDRYARSCSKGHYLK